MGLCGSKPESNTNNITPSTVKPTTTKRTKNTQNSNSSNDVNKPNKKATNTNKKGEVLGASEEHATSVSPREAARLAAEQRLKETNEKLTKGKLGQKIAKERGIKV